ncbi:MAG: hypothetical protein M9921_09770 [Fimbriimonadaceae bacterium]|nr:hypothetical protein [Chthonomonadaceae bacterium]MCO5297131.1 hypothetical protein [Fimbriimonadaceae bacterium]
MDDGRLARWAGAYRAVGCRPLDPEERAAIEALLRRSERSRRLAVQIPTTVVAGALGLTALGYGMQWWGLVMWVLAFFSIVIGPPVWLDGVKAVKLHSAELEDGRVEAFATEPGAPPQPPFEALRGSGRVLSWNGVPARKRQFVHAVSVASPPKTRRSASMPMRIAAIHPSAAGALAERTLSDDEHRELASIVHGLSPLRNPLALVGWVYVGALAANGLSRTAEDPSHLVVGAIFSALWIFISTLLSRRFSLYRRLSRDLVQGVTYASTSSGVTLRTGRGELVDAEFLPHSRALWTVEGEPATWRRG